MGNSKSASTGEQVSLRGSLPGARNLGRMISRLAPAFSGGDKESQLNIGVPVPAFNVATTSGKTLTSTELNDKKLVLYFYPKDSTPGCTTEGGDFNALYDAFTAADTLIVGVSRDSLKSHENFKAKQGFRFELASDEEQTLCKIFDVLKDKNMYGKKVHGIERSTFLMDTKGVLRHAWRKVKVDGHAQEVLDAARRI